jgi:chitin synthase
MESQKVLEAFGSCQMGNNTSGSRFGYYGEVQFNERGRMIGCKNLHYFLEKSRVTGERSNSSSNEGNFYVFYYLLAGVSPEERAALQLPSADPSQYTYLSKYKRHAASTDAAAFNELKASLKSSGFRKENISRMIQLLAAILHLGNIIFVDPTGTGTQEAAYVKNTEQLEAAAELLGLDPHALENVLTFKTTMIRKDITTLILNSEQARIQCNELCQVLYSLLFSWMVEHINRKTCVEDFNSFIGLLDFPGLQTGSLAGFEQLCVNFANEQIQQYVDHYRFELEIGQFQSEGINTPDIHIDNSAMNLFTRPKGICDLVSNMSDATRSGKRSYNDNNVMDSLVKFNSTHPSFKLKTADTGARHFCVQHFSAPVEYKTDGFISENNGQISVDFVSLFRGGMDIQPSWNAFVVDLFADANIQVENHPKHNSAIVGAQQSAKPKRAPSQRRSTRRKAGTTEKTNTEPGSTKPTAVLNQLQAALDELVQSFEEAKLWVIYCIAPRPANSKSNSGADAKYIAAQIEAFHIPSILQLPSIRYIESFNHEDFLERYHMLFDQLDTSRLLRSQCEMAAGIMGWSASQMYTTQNKVFIYLFIFFGTSLIVFIFIFRYF